VVPDDELVMPDASKSSHDLGHESFHVTESHQSSTVSVELGRVEMPAPILSSTTVQESSVHLKMPTIECSASPGEIGRPPGRVLPLTKYSEKLMRSDVTRTSAAAAAASGTTLSSSGISFRPTLQHEWFSNIHQQPATFIPTCSGVLASSFTKSLESEISVFSPDSEADVSIPAASLDEFQSPTIFHAAQSTIAPQDVYDLGLLTSRFSSFPGDDFHTASVECASPERSDFLESEALKPCSFPRSTTSSHPLHDESISVFRSPSAIRPESQLTASISGGSSAREFHLSGHTSGALTKSEVEPSLSLPLIDPDVAAGGRTPEERHAGTSGAGVLVGGRARTHPGCSTLRYNRKHNPGRDRPRTYRCHIPGRFFTIAIALSSSSQNIL